MRTVATIAQAFATAAKTVSSIAKCGVLHRIHPEDLKRVTRTPLLLISPHMMYLAYARHRQRGTQLLINTFLISRQQRLERDDTAALELMGVLDALDAAIVSNNLSLKIQPFDIYQRKAVAGGERDLRGPDDLLHGDLHRPGHQQVHLSEWFGPDGNH